MKVGENMPLVRVDMIKGKSSEYKKAVLACIHAGLIESMGIELLQILGCNYGE